MMPDVHPNRPNMPPDYEPIPRPTWLSTALSIVGHGVIMLMAIWLIKWLNLLDGDIDWLNPQYHLSWLGIIVLIFFAADNVSFALINRLIARYDLPRARPTHGTKWLSPHGGLGCFFLFYLLGGVLLVLEWMFLLTFQWWEIIATLPLLIVLLMTRIQLQHDSIWRIDYGTQTIRIYRFHRFGWQHTASRPLSDFCAITRQTNSQGKSEIILLAHTAQPNLFFCHLHDNENPSLQRISEKEKQLYRATGLPIVRRRQSVH